MIGSVLVNIRWKILQADILHARKRVFVHHYSCAIDIIVTLLGSVNQNS